VLPQWRGEVYPTGPVLASNVVATGAGETQNWNELPHWWRPLIGDPTLDDPTQTGGPALLDMTIYVTPTLTAAQDQSCGGSPTTALSFDVQVASPDPALPGGSGLIISGPSAGPPPLIVGDLLVDGVVTATDVALESTLIGHELGFRLYNHVRFPPVTRGFYITDESGTWNSLSVSVRVEVAIYLNAPTPADTTTGPGDTWDQPTEPADGPPIPEGDGTGTVGVSVPSALVAGDGASGVLR
jgi:hypothetical protein